MSRALPPRDPARPDAPGPVWPDPAPDAAFLAALSQDLAAVSDPDALVSLTTHAIGRRMLAPRVFFLEMDGHDTATVHVRPVRCVAAGEGRSAYPLAAFGAAPCWEAAAAGVVAIDDVWLHPWTAAYARSYRALDIGAWLLAPYVRDGRWVAGLVVADVVPRAWTREEATRLAHVVALAWPGVERARATRDLEVARESAARQARVFGVTLAAVRDYVFALEPDGRIAFANASLLRLWRRDADAAFGRRLADLGYAPDVEQRILRDLQQVIATRASVSGETPYAAPSGEVARYEYTLSPVFDAAGRVLQVAGTARDVTERRAAEVEVAAALRRERAARAEAERSSRIKDDFLATLSHELRTPLNAILGWAQMIRRADTDHDDLRHGLAVIERNARAQAQLIDDLLDMTRITNGTLLLDVGPVLVREVLDAAVAAARPAAEAKSLRLTVHCDPPSLVASADPARLAQVVANLVSNAVKFTPAGGHVAIDARRDGANLELVVTDSGVGIAPAFLPHVFDPFRQADASTTRRHGGLGLGLAIVRHLVHLHGGQVRARSAGADAGASFVVTLPIAERDGQSVEAPRTFDPLTGLTEERKRGASLMSTHDPLHDHPEEQARRDQPAEDAVEESATIVENESRKGKQVPPLHEAYGGEPDERNEQSR